MSRLMTEPTKWHVRPAKTQISLGICPVWSESSLCAQWVAEDQDFFMRTAKTLIRLGECPGWSESSLGAQSFCCFRHEAAHLHILRDNTKIASYEATAVAIIISLAQTGKKFSYYRFMSQSQNLCHFCFCFAFWNKPESFRVFIFVSS